MRDLILTAAIAILMLAGMSAQGQVWTALFQRHEQEDAAAEAALAAWIAREEETAGSADSESGNAAREAAKRAAEADLRKKDLEIRVDEGRKTVRVHINSGGISAAAGYACETDESGAAEMHRIFRLSD